ncbi:MAG: DUF302 domain-containing protein [Pseudomonadota bacterium]
MFTLRHVAQQFTLLFSLLLVSAVPAQAAEVQRHGQAYVVYLPGNADIGGVLERLQSELGGQNWEVLQIQHIDQGMQKYDLQIDNKLILACKSQYLAQAIKEDPYISLLIPCRFTLFRETVPGGKGQRVVLGVVDPVAEAKAMNIKQYRAAEKAAQELKTVLEGVASYYAR